ncbi:MAG: DUF4160 domain-containing protein [Chloroflexi bacterium]|nr:DUF4160 domain-containing protein [Chloroflexota bacterium]MBP8057028.1 DUF4160 domain-containing protein [Chloroflexota bacterium]
MPVILRVKGYRIWFYEADLDEPPHIHVGKEGNEAKFWVAPIKVARAGGFRDHELTEIARILAEHQNDILVIWQREQERRANR